MLPGVTFPVHGQEGPYNLHVFSEQCLCCAPHLSCIAPHQLTLHVRYQRGLISPQVERANQEKFATV